MKKLKFSFKGISSIEEGYKFTHYVINTDNTDETIHSDDLDTIVEDILDSFVNNKILPFNVEMEGKFTIDLSIPHSTTIILIVNNEQIKIPLDVARDIRSWSCFAQEETIEAKKIKALNEFAKQYPQSTSGDLQTFVLGMNAMQNLL